MARTRDNSARPSRRPQAAPPAARKRPAIAGFEARQAAVTMIVAVLHDRRALDDVLDAADGLEPRDRGLARLIAATVLRRLGELEAVLAGFITRPLPRRTGQLMPILLAASAQLLMLSTPPHAAVGIAVEQCRADPHARHFDKLANAVLRRVAGEGPALLAALDPVALNVPAWLLQRWRLSYGEATARAIAMAQLGEAALDISVKADPDQWAERLSGHVLPTGTVRLTPAGRIDELDGFGEGAWWVQDAAAALPVRLLGPLLGPLQQLAVADLCAAPGGKTAQLAAGGAQVTAVDASAQRLQRLAENLARLRLQADVVTADVGSWQPGRQFDAVLIDWPCTATGTIRRHPDILRLKRDSDVAALATTQQALLAAAAALVRPGGTLLACACSLEPEECEGQIARLLAARGDFARRPVEAGEVAGRADWISRDGDLRTLPCHDPLPLPVPGGMDAFYAARLVRQG